MAIKHSKTSTVPDGGDSSLVRPSDWNASHLIEAGTIVNADISNSAAIAETKLALASDAVAGVASRRTLGTGATQAAAGNHTHSLYDRLSFRVITKQYMNPAQNANYYIADYQSVDWFTSAVQGVYMGFTSPYDITVTDVKLTWYALSVAGSSESISMYVRASGGASSLISTISNNSSVKVFSNSNVGQFIVTGSTFCIYIDCPTWATQPTNVVVTGHVLADVTY
jgi:hypothetical protein